MRGSAIVRARRHDADRELLQSKNIFVLVFSFDQRLRVAPEIAPAEQVQADFASERAFVG